MVLGLQNFKNARSRSSGLLLLPFEFTLIDLFSSLFSNLASVVLRLSILDIAHRQLSFLLPLLVVARH